MSNHVLLAGAENLLPSVALASFNVIIALALVSVSLLLMIAVSSVAWFHDWPKELQPIRYREERWAREWRQLCSLPGSHHFSGDILHPPVEFTFDMIETELERRGVDLRKAARRFVLSSALVLLASRCTWIFGGELVTKRAFNEFLEKPVISPRWSTQSFRVGGSFSDEALDIVCRSSASVHTRFGAP
jgi:hypothetical protein